MAIKPLPRVYVKAKRPLLRVYVNELGDPPLPRRRRIDWHDLIVGWFMGTWRVTAIVWGSCAMLKGIYTLGHFIVVRFIK